MKRRSIFAAIIACAAAVSMTACGGGGSAAPATTAAAAATTAAAAAAPAAAAPAAAAEVTLGIGYTTAANDNDPYHKTATIFKQIVEEKTGGRIVVNQYPSSQLGSEPEMWEGMQTGTCDMAVMTNAYVSSYVPANGSLDLPFIFPDLETARKVLDGEYGQKLIDNMKDTGVTCLTFSEGGFRQLCTHDKGIKTPADLNGLKIRCMETKTYLSAYKALGVNATPMAWGELLTALQQGTVDGCDAPLSVLYTNGFPDICKYIDNVNLFYSPLPVCISTQVLEGLSAEDQAILKEAATEAAKQARANNDSTAESMEKDLKDQGMTIISNEEVDGEAFRNAAKACWTEMESYIGADWINDLQAQIEAAK